MLGCLHPHLHESKSCSCQAVGAREQSTNGGGTSPSLTSTILVCGHPLVFRTHGGLVAGAGRHDMKRLAFFLMTVSITSLLVFVGGCRKRNGHGSMLFER